MRLIKPISQTILISLLLIPISWAVNTEKCLETTHQIYKDFKKYSVITNQRLSWMKLSWLQKNLGSFETKKNTLAQTQYIWKCTPKSYITATFSSDSPTIYMIHGQTEVNTKVWDFMVNLDDSSSVEAFDNHVTTLTAAPKIEATTTQNNNMMPTNNEDSHIPNKVDNPMRNISPGELKEASKSIATFANNLLEKSIPEYNLKFGTTVKNATELENSIKEKIKAFGDKFVTCTAGNYEYPSIFIGLIYLKTVIKEQQGDLCITETSYKLANADVFMACRIPLQELPKLRETFVRLSETNKSPPENAQNDTQGDIAEKYCTFKMTKTK